MGAASPGRWHVWHRACKIGATSFEKVRTAGAVSAAASAPAPRHSNPSNLIPVPSLDWKYEGSPDLDSLTHSPLAANGASRRMPDACDPRFATYNSQMAVPRVAVLGAVSLLLAGCSRKTPEPPPVAESV